MQVALLITTANEDCVIKSGPMSEQDAKTALAKIDSAIGAAATTVQTDWASFKKILVAGAYLID